MIKKCSECEKDVSDKAYNCPHCGFPINETPVNTFFREFNDFDFGKLAANIGVVLFPILTVITFFQSKYGSSIVYSLLFVGSIFYRKAIRHWEH